MSTQKIINEISDIDGISPSIGQCQFCELWVHNEFFNEKFCTNCRKLSFLYQFNRTFSRLLFPSIIFGVVFYFNQYLRTYAWMFPTFVLVPLFLIGTFQKKIHFFQQEQKNMIVPLLRYSKKLQDQSYYLMAQSMWIEQYDDLSELMRSKILKELIKSTINSPKPNPTDWINKWKPKELDESKFVTYLFDETEIRDSFSHHGGTGTLPNIWPYIDSTTIKEEILDILSENLNQMEDVSDLQKKLFMEDIYLIDDEIIEIIDEEEKWDNILDALDDFHADEPPKSMREELLKSAQERAALEELN